MTRASSTFEIKNWVETLYLEPPGGQKFTQVNAAYVYEGGIEGEGTATYLMFHRADSSGSFVGLQRVVGAIEGRKGSFVLEHRGTFVGQEVEESFVVVPNSGTGELHGLRGEGVSDSNGHRLDYGLEEENHGS